MEKKVSSALKHKKWRALINGAFMSLLFMILSVLPVNAIEVYKDSDTKVQWDNTIKYSAGYRLNSQDAGLTNDINTDDGNRDFNRGFISNRLDLYSEMDVTHRNFGLRVSGAGWVDSAYLGNNDNDSPGTFNGTGSNNQFADDTKKLQGLKAELMDAFVFGSGQIASNPASFRLGRHTLLWGETLYFATNGIAYGQAPLDFVKALGVPGTQAKELFMPVAQFSGQVQLVKDLTLAAYWQGEWRRSRVPASGSYFSDVDIFDAGGERLLLGPNSPGRPGPAFYRGGDLGAGNSTSEFGEGNLDQFGTALRFRSEGLDTEFGIYYEHYNEKSPYWIYMDPTKANYAIGKIGEYDLVFPKNVHMMGASFGTQFGAVNVSGEASGRFNTPLLSTAGVILPGTNANNDDNPLYAVGNSFHANLSAIKLLSDSFLWQGGNLVAEAGYVCLINTTKNEAALDPTRDNYALGFRTVFEPAYYQVFPGIDITVPFGLGYNPKGRSPVDLKFNGGADAGGDFSVGLKVDYLQVWKFGLTYTNYFGSEDTQHLADRDFVTFSIQRTF
ncbi:MAG: DUF1302 domain-containing protein [Deltaproteobacteria bacterium]|nr:DUF1302 domain-containing protein [Deltaproteobacteria bacterium]